VDARIDVEYMLRGELVLPPDYDWPVPQCLDGWTGIVPIISPQLRGWKLRMHLLSEFQHANVVLNPVLTRALRHKSLWNRKWIYISIERVWRPISRLSASTALYPVLRHAIGKNQSWYGSHA